MRSQLSFTECLKDSPIFRNNLHAAEKDLDALESKLERVVKYCNAMVSAGETYNNANSLFINELNNLSVYFTEDDLVPTTLHRLTKVLSESNSFHVSLIDQANRSISKRISNFITEDLQKLKNSRKDFHLITQESDSVYNKHSQVQKSKPADCTELDLNLASIRSTFDHTCLDYVHQMKCMHSKKRFEILDTILAYMHAQNTYNHQGRELFEEMDSYIKNIILQLNDLNNNNQRHVTELQTMLDKTHCKDLKTRQELTWSQINCGIEIEGYLYKRTSNAFKNWVRRWFTITNNQLVYRKRDQHEELSVMEPDLRLCTVRIVELDRRWCFEIVSPSRTHTLQASSEQACMEWRQVITNSIASAYNRSEIVVNEVQSGMEIQRELHIANEVREKRGHKRNKSDCTRRIVTVSSEPAITTSTHPGSPGSPLQVIYAVAGNSLCCDCRATTPKWASTNLGITLCIVCSGIHRSLGVHISKVRSLTLDTWPHQLIKVMCALGNTVCNRIYEANVVESERATIHSNSEKRESWIKSKYIEKKFVKPLKEKAAIVATLPVDGLLDNHNNNTAPTDFLADQSNANDCKNGANCEGLSSFDLTQWLAARHPPSNDTTTMTTTPPGGGRCDRRSNVKAETVSLGRISPDGMSYDGSLLDIKTPVDLRPLTCGLSTTTLSISPRLPVFDTGPSTRVAPRQSPSPPPSSTATTPTTTAATTTTASSTHSPPSSPGGSGSRLPRTEVTISSPCTANTVVGEFLSSSTVPTSTSIHTSSSSSCSISLSSSSSSSSSSSFSHTARIPVDSISCPPCLPTSPVPVIITTTAPTITTTITTANTCCSTLASNTPATIEPLNYTIKPRTNTSNPKVITVKQLDQSSPSSISTIRCNGSDKDLKNPDDGVLVTSEMLLRQALRQSDLPCVMEAIACGVQLNSKERRHFVPLIEAVNSGSMICLEYLLQNGAKVDDIDLNGQTALHHATAHGYTGQVCVLLKRNANQNIKDNNGNDALNLALESLNGDVVTVLRINKLNKEDLLGTGDDTYNAIFKEFSDI